MTRRPPRSTLFPYPPLFRSPPPTPHAVLVQPPLSSSLQKPKVRSATASSLSNCITRARPACASGRRSSAALRRRSAPASAAGSSGGDRERVGEGKRGDFGGGRIIKKKKQQPTVSQSPSPSRHTTTALRRI